MKYGAFSEIGKLRKVMVCRPGLAHKRLTPANCKDLLFDDVIWVAEAQSELILGHWWQLAAATAFMAVFVTAFSLMTDALRDALDPKLRGAE